MRLKCRVHQKYYKVLFYIIRVIFVIICLIELTNQKKIHLTDDN